MAVNEELKIKNAHGLSIEFLDNGLVKSIEVKPIRISLKTANSFSRSGTNLYLRKRSNPIEFRPLLGPQSNSQYKIDKDKFIAFGTWDGLDYTCFLELSSKSPSWKWQIEIINKLDKSLELDVILLQDVGLKPASDSLINEYYVSQYLERLILEDEQYGSVLCCRQNNKESVGNPWLLVACKNKANSACTDGMQFLGKSFRKSGIPESLIAEQLGGEYSGELSMVALQEVPFVLTSGEKHSSIFNTMYLPDHPEATSSNDLLKIPKLFEEFNNEQVIDPLSILIKPGSNIFSDAFFLPVADLNDDELIQFFGNDRRHIERENGKILSFFYGPNKHVVLMAKELLADRPHGHIMQAKTRYMADENIMSTTSWAFGIFNSHLTQGNTNFNIFLSICTSQFNQSPETGQRIFVEIDGKLFLLGVPSAFEMGLNHCRWIYKCDNHYFQVRTWTSKSSHRINLDFKVLKGDKVKLVLTHQLDESNGWMLTPNAEKGNFVFRPKQGSLIKDKFLNAQFRVMINSQCNYKTFGDEALYSDHRSRKQSFFVVETEKVPEFSLSFIGEVCKPAELEKIENADQQFEMDCQDAHATWKEFRLNLSLDGKQKDIEAIREILPWFGMNAITHFLTPHGLEQFGGAAWGTRDVSQGPFDLLMTLEKYEDAKKLLSIIFSNQNPVGDWPQWWMFDSYFSIRANDCHGDIYYWCIIALSNYIQVTGDMEILDEVLPYYHEKGVSHAEKTPLREHMERLINMIVQSFIPGTALVPFGGGDWNDSLQPVSKDLANRMVSSWTVEMNYQAFTEYQKVYEMAGNTIKANELNKICGQIKSDFNKHLVKDGVVSGYGLLEADGSISVLLHPGDKTTGIKYSVLPMNRGIISGIFSKDQAFQHQDLVEQHLKGPDGVRLMDYPLKYKGGIQSIFQRAESSTFFGREIGLMYIHEHIRYAESLAILGKAEAFVKALRQANPVAYDEIVNCGDIRQSNCYYSSSDVAFKSRYEADERYDEVKNGNIMLRGGWRVYSSGPGIYITLIISRLLGIRTIFGKTILDPVIPTSMDGLTAALDYMGHSILLKYRAKHKNYCPSGIIVNGKEMEFSYEENKYRQGGAVLNTSAFLSLLDKNENLVEIDLS